MDGLMARVARLDAERVFMGLADPIPADEVQSGDFVFGDPALKDLIPEGAVWVERECDNPPGKYRLVAPHGDHPHWHFMPLVDTLILEVDTMIELGLAMALAGWNTQGPVGRYAQQFYGLAAKNFPQLVKRAAAKGSHR